jgi:hypothetical protein
LFLAEGQNNNPEIMFSTRYLNPDNSSQQDIRILWHGIWSPRKELRDAYESIDGLPITTSPLYDPANWKLNRDPSFATNNAGVRRSAVKASGALFPSLIMVFHKQVWNQLKVVMLKHYQSIIPPKVNRIGS